MEAQVRVSGRGLLLAAVALLGMAAAYLVGAAGQGAVTPARAAAGGSGSDAVRSVDVVGVGHATAVPDQLVFTVSVTAKRPALDQALADSSATMRTVLAALSDFGVEKSDTRTTGLSMEPEYYYPDSGPPVLTGYRVSQRARVEVGDLAQGGKAISAAVTTGGNGVRVSDLRLQVSDPAAAMAQARDDAIAEAKAKAEQYAAAAGADLAEVITVRETTAPARPPTVWVETGALRDRVGKGAVPIRAGESELTVRVQVVWGLG